MVSQSLGLVGEVCADVARDDVFGDGSVDAGMAGEWWGLGVEETESMGRGSRVEFEG